MAASASSKHESFDLQSCLEGVRSRDEAAARRLVEEYEPLVRRIARARLGRREEVEDLMQQVFLNVFRSLDNYDPRAPFEHWISRIAANACRNQWRTRQRKPELRFADLSEEQQGAIEAIVADRSTSEEQDVDNHEILQRLMDELKEADRLVITLLDLEERSTAEISEITGWSRSAIAVRALRARRKLRKLFTQLEKHT